MHLTFTKVKNMNQIKLQFHSELNPALWVGDKLQPDVKDALMTIVSEFISFLKVKVVPIDIIIVGSSVNYNYTEHSDIDVHVIVDFSKINKNKDFVKEFFTDKKYIWNKEHDIKIYGHEVEMYVQNVDEKIRSAAVFSLKKNKWEKMASKERPEVDIASVKEKVKSFSENIDSAKGDKDGLAQLRNKLKEMRLCGLELGGEYSTENLTFKVLRNSGEIERLFSYAKQAFDKKLSLKEWDELL